MVFPALIQLLRYFPLLPRGCTLSGCLSPLVHVCLMEVTPRIPIALKTLLTISQSLSTFVSPQDTVSAHHPHLKGIPWTFWHPAGFYTSLHRSSMTTPSSLLLCELALSELVPAFTEKRKDNCCFSDRFCFAASSSN